MKNFLLYLAIGITCIFLVGCGGENPPTEEQETSLFQTSEQETVEQKETIEQQGETSVGVQYKEEWQIDTHSRYSGSFRKAVGEEKKVIYLGMPRKLTVSDGENIKWISSDPSVATVRDGEVTGWKEGLVTIQGQRETDEIVYEEEFVVTTFNDGKKAENCYEIERAEYLSGVHSFYNTVAPEVLRLKINTIQDMYEYFLHSGCYYSPDGPILTSGGSLWLWSLPGDDMLNLKYGSPSDFANAASYLLQYDFEDWGYIYGLGSNIKIYNWFYEDGYYYIVDFYGLIKDIEHGYYLNHYDPFKTDKKEEIAEYLLSRTNTNGLLAFVMMSARGHDFMPAFYSSCLQDSSKVYKEHVEYGFEETVYNEMTILYENQEFDFSIRCVPSDEIPEGVPRYDNAGYRYPYE